MMTLLPVLACCGNDASAAEKFLDLAALYKSKKPTGYLLLAFNYDVHPEFQTRLRVAAEIGFETVETLVVAPSPESSSGKAPGLNNLFQKASQHIARNYRLPFLWLEPDCVPLKVSWLEDLVAAYENQPKPYMSSVLTNPQTQQTCIGRVAFYPRIAATELNITFGSKAPFEIEAGGNLVARTSKTKLIQILPILTLDDRAKIREDAVLLHWDKQGILLQALMDEHVATNGNSNSREVFDGPETLRNCAPLKPYHVLSEAESLTQKIPKLDGRSKAARALKKAKGTTP